MDREQIFQAAVEIDNPQERRFYLDHACQGDEQLKREVEELLRHDAEAGSFLEPKNAEQVTGVHAHRADQVGVVIAGRYKLLEEIGEGGMGSVWVAQQTEPIRRRVAVKLIKPGMDSRQVLARFEAERQALALMDHPNIAKVLDAGLTDEGRPFFAMEYVKGVPLVEYCDRAKLSIRQRLELFTQVCQAVQHAHQKGIIHRDLKPSNILVCLYDGVPVPKVIDFGLAKAMHQQLTERTLHTLHGMMVGTPLYMSPEQAEFNNLDIDTRSDIYSLGVILYELLTGATPLDRQRFKNAAWQEMVRLIKEEEPSKPSTKLSGSGSLPTVAAQRSLEPAQLCRLVRGDLDWIVMKALEKERSRRYETANGLARDVERYLHDDPVEARPPTTRYRLGKLARRYRGAVVAGSMVAIALLTGMSLATWQAVRATRAERAIQLALDEAEKERSRAEEGFREARRTVDKFYTEVSENELLNVPGLQPLRQKLLQEALEAYQKFIEQYGDNPELQAELASAYHRMGRIIADIGSKEQALAAYQQAAEIVERLVQQAPSTPAWTTPTADDIPFRNHRHALGVILGDAGRLQFATGRYSDAEPSLRKAIELQTALVVQFPKIAAFRQHLAANLESLGILHDTRGELSAASDAFRRAMRIREALVRVDPGDRYYRAGLCNSLINSAHLLNETEAAVNYQRAKDIVESLLANDPHDLWAESTRSLVHSNLAAVHYRSGDHAAAEASARQAYEIAAQLSQKNPTVNNYRARLARCAGSLGMLLNGSGRHDEAELLYARSIGIFEDLVRDHPGVTGYQADLALCLSNLTGFRKATGRIADAEQSCQRAISLLEQMVADNPRSFNLPPNLATAYMQQAELKMERGRHAEAQGLIKRYVEIVRPLVGLMQQRDMSVDSVDTFSLDNQDSLLGPIAPRLRIRTMFNRMTESPREALANAYLLLAKNQLLNGQRGDAEQSIRGALEQFTAIIDSGQARPFNWQRRGDVLAMLNQWPEAAEAYQVAAQTGEPHWIVDFQHALLNLAAGDAQAYRAKCSDLIDRHGADATGNQAAAIALACVAGENALDDYGPVLELAGRVAAAEPSNPIYKALVAGLQFRAGEIEPAVAVLKQVTPMHALAEVAAPQRADIIRSSRLACETMLAMAYRQQQDYDSLRRQVASLQRTIADCERKPPRLSDEFAMWTLPLAIHLAKRELPGLEAALAEVQVDAAR